MTTVEARETDLLEDGAELIARLQQQHGTDCVGCGRRLCMHEILGSIALGAGASPRCLRCLAAALQQSEATLSQSLWGYFQGRDCYAAACTWVSQQQQKESTHLTCCLLGTSGESKGTGSE